MRSRSRSWQPRKNKSARHTFSGHTQTVLNTCSYLALLYYLYLFSRVESERKNNSCASWLAHYLVVVERGLLRILFSYLGHRARRIRGRPHVLGGTLCAGSEIAVVVAHQAAENSLWSSMIFCEQEVSSFLASNPRENKYML